MKYIALLPALFSAFALSAGPMYPSTGTQSSISPQENDTAMPAPKPGQSVEDFVEMYFTDVTGDEQGEETQPDVTKRNFTSNKGVMISKWTNNTAGTVEEDYEIDVDFSPCDSGMNFSTEVGVFTTKRGTPVTGRPRCSRLH